MSSNRISSEIERIMIGRNAGLVNYNTITYIHIILVRVIYLKIIIVQ